MIRIYTKPKGAIPDYNEPVILSRTGSPSVTFATHFTRKSEKFKYAWVGSRKHQPQKCGLAHDLDDEDIVQIVKSKNN